MLRSSTLLHSSSSHRYRYFDRQSPAYDKLMRGEVSSSSRVTTFLSTATTVFTPDTSMVLHIYHQTSEAAILVSAIARVVRFASSFKRWKTPVYSVFPWTMVSTVLSRCHSLAVLPSMPLSSSVQISDALMLT